MRKMTRLAATCAAGITSIALLAGCGPTEPDSRNSERATVDK